MEIKCHNCIHASETPDGIGFYCDRPMSIAIECTKHDHKYFIAKPVVSERTKLIEAVKLLTDYCNSKSKCADCPFNDTEDTDTEIPCLVGWCPESWNTDKIDEKLEDYYHENSDL